MTQPWSSDSADVMLSSLTHNVEDLILLPCSNILQRYELSASLEEKHTLMEEFTYTLLSTSVGNIQQETLVSLMWRDATRMSWLVEEHRKKCGTTRRKMAMLSLGGLSDQVEAQFLELVIHGLTSSWRRVEIAFSNYVRNWLLELSLVPSLLYDATQTGDTDPFGNHTPRLPEYPLTQTTFQNSVNGYKRIWMDTDQGSEDDLWF